MLGSTARRAFFCGATCAGFHCDRYRRFPPKHGGPLMCASSPSLQPPSTLKRKSLGLTRSAFIRKNANPVSSEYELGGEDIGEGAYSTVFTATSKFSGVPRAIKAMPKSITDAEAFEVEVDSLVSLDHPHIVKILQYFDESDKFYIVFELLEGPDLVEYLVKRVGELENYVPEVELSRILRQMLKAILACHENGIVHRDVKPENFMISGEEMTVKMIDLGLACRNAQDGEHERTGTYRYMAPEIYFQGECGYGKAVDMWALGVSFYIMLTLEPLLPDEGEEVLKLLQSQSYVEEKVKSCQVLQDRNLSEDARDFLNRLLTYNPEKRITVEEALAHPFIQDSGEDGLTPIKHGEIKGTMLNKMSAFAEACPLERIARLAIAHTISQGPGKESIELRLIFRTLNKSGNGKLSVMECAKGLVAGGLTLPANFQEIFTGCSSSGSPTLSFTEFFASNLPESFLNEQLCATVFRLLDRDGNGVLEAKEGQNLATTLYWSQLERKA